MATEVTDELKANASFDMDRADLPENVRAVYMAAKPVVPPIDPVTKTEGVFAESVSALAKDAGFEAHAPMWALACTSLDQVKGRITAAAEITAFCKLASLPDQAVVMITANKSVDEAKAELVEMKAKADEGTHTDTTKPIKQSARSNAKPEVSTASIWASHRAQSKK